VIKQGLLASERRRRQCSPRQVCTWRSFSLATNSDVHTAPKGDYRRPPTVAVRCARTAPERQKVTRSCLKNSCTSGVEELRSRGRFCIPFSCGSAYEINRLRDDKGSQKSQRGKNVVRQVTAKKALRPRAGGGRRLVSDTPASVEPRVAYPTGCEDVGDQIAPNALLQGGLGNAVWASTCRSGSAAGAREWALYS